MRITERAACAPARHRRANRIDDISCIHFFCLA
jgi:hypothetical protein